MSVFLDSGYIIALANKKDNYHGNAARLSELIQSKEFGEIFISDYVFDETMTYLFAKQNHSKAVEIGKRLLNSEIRLISVSESIFEQAWQLFQERKNLSFTDCTNIKIMAENSIKNLATFDKEFQQFKEINVLM